MPAGKPKVVAVVAPHPDDETLGCGGTLLKHIAQGDEVHWIIFTGIFEDLGFTKERINLRHHEILQVAKAYSLSATHQLGFPATQLDHLPKADMVGALGKLIGQLGVHTMYVPYRNDAHSDHAVVFDACAACAKSFRYPSVRSVRAYETLSETEFGIRTDDPGFRPNLFIDISNFLERKLEIMNIYSSEMAPFPFPRSVVTIQSQAHLRGSQCGVTAAESFMILKEIA